MTLVFGIGSPLRGDDALGAAVVARLDGADGVRAVAVHQLLPEHAAELLSADTVVFVDASVALPPGEVHVERVAPENAPAEFSHALDPRGLLALARALSGASPAAWLVSVGAQSFELMAPLSEPVEAAIDEAVRIIRGL